MNIPSLLRRYLPILDGGTKHTGVRSHGNGGFTS